MKRIIALGAVVALVVIGWTGFWFYAASRITSEAELLATPGNPYGITVNCGTFNVSGYPFRFDITCADAGMVEGDLSFALAELRLSARVYRPNHVLVFAKGPFAFADAFFGTQQQLDWETFEASVRIENNRLARASVQAETVIWSDTLIGETELATMDAFEAHLLPLSGDGATADRGLALFVRGSDISAPAQSIAEGRVVLEAELENFPTDTRLWADPALFANWQARDGKANLLRLEADDTTSTLTANGTLWLSAAGFPEADLKVRSEGVAEKFDLDQASQNMFFGTRGADGTRGQTIIVREGSILVGLVPSGRLAPWF